MSFSPNGLELRDLSLIGLVIHEDSIEFFKGTAHGISIHVKVSTTSRVLPFVNVEMTVAFECQPLAVGPESNKCVRGSSRGSLIILVMPPPIGTWPGSQSPDRATRAPARGRSMTPEEMD